MSVQHILLLLDMYSFLDAIGEEGGGDRQREKEKERERERKREREERPTIDGDAESESRCSLHCHLKRPRRWHNGVIDVKHDLHLYNIAGLLHQLHGLLQRNSLCPDSVDG